MSADDDHPETDLALRLRGVHHAFGARPVLDRIDLEARRGELVGVLGPNGAGKSTLLRIALGFIRPHSGDVRIYGRSVDGMARKELARAAAFVPQFYETDLRFSVHEMVAMGRTPYLGHLQPESEIDRAAIERALRDSDLESMQDREFRELSGGERQRVMLARAFAQEASLLVLDEPSANLDPFHAWQLLEVLRKRVQDGNTVVAALHDLDLAARYCDRLVVLTQGAIAAEGSPRDVLTPALLARVFRIDAAVLSEGGDVWVRVRSAIAAGSSQGES